MADGITSYSTERSDVMHLTIKIAARLSHLVTGKGGVAGEVDDLRGDVEVGFTANEDRTDYPELDWLDITGGALLAAGGDIVLEGRNILQGQTFATLTLWATTSAVVITAMKPGVDGNDFTITVTGTGTAGAETVIKTANAFVIDIDATTSTADQIATAINANLSAGVNDGDGYIMAVSGGSGTANAVAAVANLAGGAGVGFECLVSGVEALPANTTGATGVALVDDDGCTVTVPALTAESPARAAADIVGITIKTDGVKTQQLSGVLA